MSAEQSRRLFALLRQAAIVDRHAWASGLLGREIGSYTQLTAADADRLIRALDVPALAGGRRWSS